MISGTIWQWMMDADSGVINNFLKLFGLDPVWWLQADHSLWAVIIANIWLGIPFNLVILYSGLQNINGDLYEAAAWMAAMLGSASGRLLSRCSSRYR